MNTFSKAIKDVTKLHYGQRLHRVVTSPIAATEDVKDYFVPNSLNYAAIETLEVMMIQPNESRTGLLIAGNLIRKTGELLFPDDPKKSFKQKIEIPFDQNSIIIQPGVWFDDQKVAQAFAKDINIKTKAAIERIQKSFEKYRDELDDFIQHGV